MERTSLDFEQIFHMYRVMHRYIEHTVEGFMFKRENGKGNEEHHKILESMNGKEYASLDINYEYENGILKSVCFKNITFVD